jgi:hypothetical protein
MMAFLEAKFAPPRRLLLNQVEGLADGLVDSASKLKMIALDDKT